ncbi:phage gp6-like head-tail connector protein [Escherichia coli]|uniref:phage gp6-like head-tail connector protein n=1 Tax=Escherichia coli TaxID=562 RepID=UPI00200DF132|nr:phage gp6-like head-tail connector protein [Escherichia coli]
MNERDLSLIKALGEEFGAAIQKMADDFQQALEKTASNLEKQLEELRRSIPEVQPVEIPDVSKMVSEAVSAIELPKAPELPDLSQSIADAAQSAVKQALESLPKPKDGKSVSAEDLRSLVEEVVSASLPEPVDVEKLAEDVAANIPVPEPGSDGKDALSIELEPFIDEKKSYPRGTYATHNGGLWRSHEKTHGMRGWECIVDGVSNVDIKQDNQRTFSISLERASGAVEVKSFDVPVTIYRDVFKTGTEYQPGDTVTWGGSMWHCNEPTTDKPGETGSKGWTLAVKKGRDLRDKP